jgi:hypothetical protein
MVALGEDWNSRQLRKRLIEEYPYLQPRRMTDGEVSPDYDYQYIMGEHDLPEGWMELFLQCCEDIKEPLARAGDLDKFRFVQIKEKFGRMTLYVYGATDEVHRIIDKYGFLSEQVCSVCGRPATVMTYGYVCPYCSEHVRGSMENVDDAELIEIKTSYVQERWSQKGKTREVVDCSNEWYRYLNRIGYTDEK